MCFQFIQDKKSKNIYNAAAELVNIPAFSSYTQKKYFSSSYKKELISKISKLNNEVTTVSIEHMRLMTHVKKIACNDNFFVLDIDELDSFGEILAKFEKNNKMYPRFQLIVKNEAHYTAVDILWGYAKKECLILDAAGDFKALQLAIKLAKFGFDNLFLVSGSPRSDRKTNNLQKDRHSCALFALDHAFQVSKLNIYNVLEAYIDKNKKNEPTFLFWEDLPSPLVWNAQSFSFLMLYLEKNKGEMQEDEIKAFQAYLAKNEKIEKNKLINQAIYNLFEIEKESMIKFIEELEEEEIRSISSSSVLEEISAFFQANINLPNLNFHRFDTQ